MNVIRTAHLASRIINTQNTCFVCPRFENERRDLSIRVGRTPAACNLVVIMLESEVNWSAICNMATTVLNNLVSKKTAKFQLDRILESPNGLLGGGRR